MPSFQKFTNLVWEGTTTDPVENDKRREECEYFESRGYQVFTFDKYGNSIWPRSQAPIRKTP